MQTVHFAVDTTLYPKLKTFRDVSDGVEIDIEHLQEWLKVNRLSLNVSKTKFMILTNKSISNNIKINFSDRTIEQVYSHKILGVIIDQNHLSMFILVMYAVSFPSVSD